MFVALFVAAIVVVVVIHEAGHYVGAKAFGMKVDKFFVGFGPTLFSRRVGETEYGVKAIPAGGFVKVPGMSRTEETDPADAGRLYLDKPAWQRAVMVGLGPVTHFVLVALLLVTTYAVTGVPTDEPTNEVAVVLEDTPAEAAGLRAGDRIVAVDGTATPTFDDASAAIGVQPGDPVSLTVDRDGERLTLDATAAAREVDGETRGYLGFSPAAAVRDLTLVDAVSETFGTGDLSMWSFVEANTVGLVQALSPEGLGALTGRAAGEATADEPQASSLVGVGRLVSEAGQAGDLRLVLLLFAAINVAFGVLNLIPLPPFDGGHLAVIAVEKGVNGVRRLAGRAPTWRLDIVRLTPIALAVLLFFGFVFLTSLYADIVNPVRLR